MISKWFKRVKHAKQVKKNLDEVEGDYTPLEFELMRDWNRRQSPWPIRLFYWIADHF